MSLYQHCDVEGCDSSAEMSNGGMNAPFGWFIVSGMTTVDTPPQKYELNMEGREISVQVPNGLMPRQGVEMVTFVVCGKHNIPWKVKTTRQAMF